MKNLVQQYPILGSSANQEKLSESIRGLLILAIPGILRALDIDIEPNTILALFDTYLLIHGGVVTMFGLIRKFYYQVMPIIEQLKK